MYAHSNQHVDLITEFLSPQAKVLLVYRTSEPAHRGTVLATNTVGVLFEYTGPFGDERQFVPWTSITRLESLKG